MRKPGARADWLAGAADPGGIADLIMRRKWSKAIEILRGQLLEGHVPSVQGRLQLADLMVMAGRGPEAVPVLLGLADEFAADHFVAKAIAILKRVERLDPGRPDVAERLGLLVQTQSRLASDARVAAWRAPDFDMEEIQEVDLGSDAQDGTQEEAGGAQGSIPAEDGETDHSGPAPQPEDGEGERLRDGRGRTSTPDAARQASDVGAGGRLRRVLRRVLGLPESAERIPRGAVDIAAGGGASVLGAEGGPAPSEEAVEGARTEALDGPFVEMEEVLEADAAGGVGFREGVLDLVGDVLRHAPAEARPEAEVVPGDDLAARLVAVPLFGGLSSEELLAVVRGLALRTFEPGDAIVTEGEAGRSLFILTSGQGKVFVHSRDGHPIEVGRVAEGDFFGEISALSGSRRGATVTAAEPCEALELEKEVLDAIALAHPRVRETLEASYLAHAGDPDAAAVRAVDLRDRHVPRKALSILETRFGESRWTPRMRLKLADVLAKAGHYDDALPVLVSLADDLVRHGQPAKAIAIVKKIERIQQRDVAELPLAPLSRAPREARAAGAPRSGSKSPKDAAGGFEEWLLRLAREAVRGREGADRRGGDGREGAEPPPGYGPGLRSSALFEDFADAELLALVQGLSLVCHGPGDIIVSEGEPGESVFVIASGSVRVLVRDPQGRSVSICRLDGGCFFGEIAALSGRPRSATVTAAETCELLELDRAALDTISARHPRVREVMEQAYLERAADPAAEQVRRGGRV